MDLIELRSDYLNGKIEKNDYIIKMHDIHKELFKYQDFIKHTDINKIEITSSNVVITTKRDGIKLLCDKDDQRITPIEMLNFSDYENEELYIVKKIIKENILSKEKLVMLDIGANIGLYSINIGKDIRNSEIHSFEPIPKTFNYLKKNIELNNLENITINNFGISDMNKNIEFYYDKKSSGNASVLNVSDNPDAELIQTKVKKIDDYVKENKLKINFIKCDVEGSELFVFKGGLETLKDHKPIIFTEILRKWSKKFNYHPNDILDLLESIGYSCFVIENFQLKPFFKVTENTTETNYLFINTEKYKIKV